MRRGAVGFEALAVLADARATPRTTPTTLVEVPPDPAQANLRKIDHFVVLMMENRSFDHMLGYLRLEGGRDDIDGLTGDESNRHKGEAYGPTHLGHTRFPKTHDPGHSGAAVARQIADDNGGFVADYARLVGDDDASLVMGYYNGNDLPVYDHLAREFAVCDRWFCSVPGSTWPNRLYAMTGGADGSHDNKKPIPFYDRVGRGRRRRSRGRRPTASRSSSSARRRPDPLRRPVPRRPHRPLQDGLSLLRSLARALDSGGPAQLDPGSAPAFVRS